MRGRRRRLTPKRILVGLLILAVLATLVLGYRVTRTALALNDARGDAAAVQQHLVAGDIDAARRTIRDLADATGTARSHAQGWTWSAASRLPVVGDDLAATRTVAEVLDELTRKGTPTLLDLAEALDSGQLRPDRGRFDVAALRSLGPQTREAATAVRGPAAQLASVEPGDLIGPTGPIIGELQEKVATASGGLEAAADALAILPDLLGQGTHHFLMLFQNNAELRSTGGLLGSMAVIEARDGKVRMVRQGSAADLGPLANGRAGTKQERRVFGADYGADIRGINVNPDFPRVAQIAKRYVLSNWKYDVDAVVAVDPVAMSEVLKGSPPLQLKNGAQLTAANAVPLLLNQIYAEIDDPAAQDDLFENAAKVVFNGFVSGQGDPVTMLRGLATAAGQGRVMIWSDRDDITKAVENTQVSGELNPDDDRPRFGVYLNDGGSWKMGYYLRHEASVKSVRCADGYQRLKLTSTLTNVATSEVLELPKWVSGDGTFAPKGTAVTSVRLYAPLGSRVLSVTVDGRDAGQTDGEHEGRPIATTGLFLEPGQSAEIEMEVESGSGQIGDIVLDSTPDISTPSSPLVFPSSCR